MHHSPVAKSLTAKSEDVSVVHAEGGTLIRSVSRFPACVPYITVAKNSRDELRPPKNFRIEEFIIIVCNYTLVINKSIFYFVGLMSQNLRSDYANPELKEKV